MNVLNLKLSNKEKKDITFSNFNKPINLKHKTKNILIVIKFQLVFKTNFLFKN